MTHSASSGQATGFDLRLVRERLAEGFYDSLAVFARHELNLKLSEDQRRLAEFLQDVENRRAIVSAGRGAGKALALDTPLPTVDGWTSMGEVKVGDWLFDEMGHPCRVTYVSPVYLGNRCYEVELSDGTVIVADAGHLWETWTIRERKETSGRPRLFSLDMTTEELQATLKRGPRGETNHAVDVCQPLALPTMPLPIDPYVLGIWLGDGHKASSMLTTADDEVVDWVQKAGYSVVEKTTSGWGVTYRLGVPGKPSLQREKNTGRWQGGGGSLRTQLRELGVLENKHIPAIYLRAGLEQRLALLQGLMDSDGYIDQKGRCEFTSTSERLARGFYELCSTLGLKATFKVGRARLNGKDCGDKFRVHFTPYICVSKLTRKAKRLHEAGNQARRQFRRYIVDIRPVESVPVRCIQVDSPSHLYLASRAFVPTHNTMMGAVLAVWSATALAERLRRTYQTMVIGGTQKQADFLYDYCRRFIDRSPYLSSRLRGEPLKSETRFKNGSLIMVHAASPGGVRHAHVDCLIFDEVAVARDDMVRASFSMVDEAPYPRIVLLSTPHDPMSVFVAIWQDAEREGFRKFNWDSSRCPWKDREEVALKETTLSREQFTVEYRGLPSSYENAIFSLGDIRECRVGEKPKRDGDSPVILGIDWGFAPGLHETVAIAAQRQGERFVVLRAEKIEGKPEEKQERIKAIYHELQVERAFADMSHISENQRLAEAGLQVTQVPFQNRKKEMVYRAQRLFQQRQVRIFDQELELIKQLTHYQWGESKTGKLTPMKGRDDFVDALLLALTGAETYHATSLIKAGRYSW